MDSEDHRMRTEVTLEVVQVTSSLMSRMRMGEPTTLSVGFLRSVAIVCLFTSTLFRLLG